MINAMVLDQLFKLLWLRITDEGSVDLTEIYILSILLSTSDLKWCINLSRSLFYIPIVNFPQLSG